MPIVSNASGHRIYVPAPTIQVGNPEDFFIDDPDEYHRRIGEARYRVIETIRFHQRPLCGRGFNHQVDADGPDFDELAKFIDLIDGRRARRLQKQRIRERMFSLAPGERRLRSPQDIKRRRSAIFSGDDFPDGHFEGVSINKFEFDDLVDKVRRHIIEAAISKMWREYEIEYHNGTWTIKVSVLDQHIANKRTGKRRSTKVKLDDRSFHGHPNRDRKKHNFAA
jgi:hypothetical protein